MLRKGRNELVAGIDSTDPVRGQLEVPVDILWSTGRIKFQSCSRRLNAHYDILVQVPAWWFATGACARTAHYGVAEVRGLLALLADVSDGVLLKEPRHG